MCSFYVHIFIIEQDIVTDFVFLVVLKRSAEQRKSKREERRENEKNRSII